MGLKTNNYNVKVYGITLENAYARLTDIHIGINGRASANFEIQQERTDIGIKQPFERVHIGCIIDKDLPVHKQIYEYAKETVFADWEDDIVDETAGQAVAT